MNKAANVKWIWLSSMKSCQSHISWRIIPSFRSRKFLFYWLSVCSYFFSYIFFSFIFTFCPSPFLFLFPSVMHFILPFFSPHLTTLLFCLWFSLSRHLKCFGLLLSLRLNVFFSSFAYLYFLLYLFLFVCLFIYYFIIFFSCICFYFISLFLYLSFPLVFSSVLRPVISYSF